MTHPIKEHSMVALLEDLPEHRLHAGDVGTIVLIHGKGEAYEVEFVNPSPPPRYAVVTVEADKVLALNYYEPRPVASRR